MAIRFTQEFVVSQFKEKHGDGFDYSEVVYQGDGIPVKIRCRLHDTSFEATPELHKRNKGGGCSFCGNSKRAQKRKLDISFMVERFLLIHESKYEYPLIEQEYQNAFSKITIICKEHGCFKQSLFTHKKSGCPKCGDASCSKLRSITKESFIERSIKKHLGVYRYKNIPEILRYSLKVFITCPKHGDFNQTIGSHLAGNGCPKCKNSAGELYIESFLQQEGMQYESQYKFKECRYKRELPFDFFIPSMNMCIEFQGDQHFRAVARFGGTPSFELIKKRDKIKEDFCRNNAINLLILTKENIKDLKQFLNDKFRRP